MLFVFPLVLFYLVREPTSNKVEANKAKWCAFQPPRFSVLLLHWLVFHREREILAKPTIYFNANIMYTEMHFSTLSNNRTYRVSIIKFSQNLFGNICKYLGELCTSRFYGNFNLEQPVFQTYQSSTGLQTLSPTLCPNLNKRVQNSLKFKFGELLGQKGIYGFSDQIVDLLIVDSTFLWKGLSQNFTYFKVVFPTEKCFHGNFRFHC